MYYFTTYFDKNYLSRGLVLCDSLKEHCERFELYVLCLDDFTLDFFQKNARNYPEVKTLSLNEIEEYDKEFKECKKNRSTIEYYFTLSPCLPLYLLKKYNLPHICSLDADMMFFSTPTPLFTYLENFSIVITPHKFSPELKSLEKYGIYNVSFQIFKNDEVGIACLEKWRNQCIEWCFDYVDNENSRFADQRYLDDWPTRFPGVVVLQHKGAGLAPWNITNYHLRLDNGQVVVDSQPLVFFHFHGLKQIRWWLYNPNLATYRVHADYLLKRRIYGPYIRELQEVDRWISVSLPFNQAHIHMGSIRGGNPGATASSNFLRVITRRIKHQLFATKKVLQGDIFVVIDGRIV